MSTRGGATADAPLQVRLLGPLEVRRGDEVVDVGAGRQRTLLAYLALHPNEVVHGERLIDVLWGDDPPSDAGHALVVCVAALRRSLEPERSPRDRGGPLRTQAPGYALVVDAEAVDAGRFERLSADGQTALEEGDPAHAASLLREALDLWRGPALIDFSYMDFAQAAATRLAEVRLAALEARFDADLALGRHSQVVGELEALTAANPLREGFWSKRMLALYRCGRQAESLRAYQDLRRVLGEELGIEPSPSVQALEQAVLQHDPSLDWSAPGRVTDVPGPDLPTGVVTFMLTDIESSSTLWEAHPQAMADSLTRHDDLIVKTVETRGGIVLKAKGEGDATVSVFQWASDALQAAFDLQANIAVEPWAGGIDLQVRIALHTGEAQLREGDYYGPTLNRAARLRALARGGQTVISHTTAEVGWERLPLGSTLVDLGHHQLRGLSRGERVFELCPADAPAPAPAAGAATASGDPTATWYAEVHGRHVAYEVVGDGPTDLLLLHSDFIPIDMARDDPGYARALDELSSFCRVIRLDRPGIGLSDPLPPETVGALEPWLEAALAVLDTLGCEQTAVMGTNGGGGQAAMFLAATQPARVASLVLFQTYARLCSAPDYPIGWDPVAATEFLDTVTAGDRQNETAFDLLRTTDSTVSDDDKFRAWWKRAGLHGATPGTAHAMRLTQISVDLRQFLPSIEAPTLVLHRGGAGTYFSASFGRYIADQIVDSSFVELQGTDNLWWLDAQELLEEIRGFLTLVKPPKSRTSAIAAVLAVDLVDPKKIAAGAGEHYWAQVLERYRTVVEAEVARRGAQVSKLSGANLVARYDGVARAVRSAVAIRAAVRELGYDIRAGVHVGEVEVGTAGLRGPALDVTARVMGCAAVGEVLVTSTVPPVVVGSGIEFGDRGKHELNRVPEGWRLFRVERAPTEGEHG